LRQPLLPPALGLLDFELPGQLLSLRQTLDDPGVSAAQRLRGRPREHRRLQLGQSRLRQRRPLRRPRPRNLLRDPQRPELLRRPPGHRHLERLPPPPWSPAPGTSRPPPSPCPASPPPLPSDRPTPTSQAPNSTPSSCAPPPAHPRRLRLRRRP